MKRRRPSSIRFPNCLLPLLSLALLKIIHTSSIQPVSHIYWVTDCENRKIIDNWTYTSSRYHQYVLCFSKSVKTGRSITIGRRSFDIVPYELTIQKYFIFTFSMVTVERYWYLQRFDLLKFSVTEFESRKTEDHWSHINRRRSSDLIFRKRFFFVVALFISESLDRPINVNQSFPKNNCSFRCRYRKLLVPASIEPVAIFSYAALNKPRTPKILDRFWRQLPRVHFSKVSFLTCCQFINTSCIRENQSVAIFSDWVESTA